MLMNAQPKPRPRLLERREAASKVKTQDQIERAKCHVRSGGRCEVIEVFHSGSGWPLSVVPPVRCQRRATENHHLIGGSGRRNTGRSIMAAHRLDVCQRCHQDITGKVLVPVDGTKKEHAATVRYERRR